MEDQDTTQFFTRMLTEEECRELHQWVWDLPETKWSHTDACLILEDLLLNRRATVVLPNGLASMATYAKLKWA